MRRGIFWIFLFVLGASLLGATVFREQVAQAVGSTSGSAPVTETNLDANGFIRVHDQGTVNVALTSTGSTVKIDPAGNTVSLSSTDRAKLDTANTHLRNIEGQANKLNFDGSGNLKTAASPPALATKFYNRTFSVDNDNTTHLFDFPEKIKATMIIVSNADDDLFIDFYDAQNGGLNFNLRLNGEGKDGAANYTLPLSQPLEVNGVDLLCANTISNCRFTINVIGS